MYFSSTLETQKRLWNVSQCLKGNAVTLCHVRSLAIASLAAYIDLHLENHTAKQHHTLKPLDSQFGA
jgi:hypothetical protein